MTHWTLMFSLLFQQMNGSAPIRFTVATEHGPYGSRAACESAGRASVATESGDERRAGLHFKCRAGDPFPIVGG
jgi:hypothetical protein